MLSSEYNRERFGCLARSFVDVGASKPLSLNRTSTTQPTTPSSLCRCRTIEIQQIMAELPTTKNTNEKTKQQQQPEKKQTKIQTAAPTTPETKEQGTPPQPAAAQWVN